MQFIIFVLAMTALISPVMAQQEPERMQTTPQTAPSTAQSTPPSASSSDPRQQIRSGIRDRIAQRSEQRVADFKNALRLTPEQEARWPAFESSVRDYLRVRAQQLANLADSPPSTPADRLRRRAEGLADLSNGLKRLADAEEALYTTLSDAQKDRFRDYVSVIRPGTDREDRESNEGGRFRERDRWSYQPPHWRHHMRDEDGDWRDRRNMMRRHHMRDEEDGDAYWDSPDRDRRPMCNCYTDRMRDHWRDERDRSWMDHD